MGVGAGLYMCDVVKKLTFAISSPDEFLYKRSHNKPISTENPRSETKLAIGINRLGHGNVSLSTLLECMSTWKCPTI